MNENKETLLEVKGLSVAFQQAHRRIQQNETKVITDLSFQVNAGEIVAIVGQSGSGKSVLAHAVLDILPNNACVDGIVKYKNETLTKKRLQELRGNEIVYVPQSVTYLDPLMKIEKQILGFEKIKERKDKLHSVSKRLALSKKMMNQYPHQLSGGMTRRVLAATAMVTDASLIIADEPTPGMSVEQAVESLRIFKEFARQGKGVLLITHDLELACQFADKLAVFYEGTILEITSSMNYKDDVKHLLHPYTKALFKALPQYEFQQSFDVANLQNTMEQGCKFYSICDRKMSRCKIDQPNLLETQNGYVRCFYGN